MNDDERTVTYIDHLVPFVGKLVDESLRGPAQHRMTSRGLSPARDEYF